MAAADSTTLNWDNTMISWILRRKTVLASKTSYFGKFLELKQKRFNDYCIQIKDSTTFKEYLVPCAIADWRALPNSEKEEYRKLCRLHNNWIDVQVAEIDREIIKLRYNQRKYNGVAPTSNAAGGHGESEDLWFNPVYWYIFKKHQTNLKEDRHYANTWHMDLRKLEEDGLDEWPSLVEKEKQKFIDRAKWEWNNYYGGKRDCEGAGAVDAILAAALAQRLLEKEAHRSVERIAVGYDDDSDDSDN